MSGQAVTSVKMLEESPTPSSAEEEEEESASSSAEEVETETQVAASDLVEMPVAVANEVSVSSSSATAVAAVPVAATTAIVPGLGSAVKVYRIVMPDAEGGPMQLKEEGAEVQEGDAEGTNGEIQMVIESTATVEGGVPMAAGAGEQQSTIILAAPAAEDNVKATPASKKPDESSSSRRSASTTLQRKRKMEDSSGRKSFYACQNCTKAFYSSMGLQHHKKVCHKLGCKLQHDHEYVSRLFETRDEAFQYMQDQELDLSFCLRNSKFDRLFYYHCNRRGSYQAKVRSRKTLDCPAKFKIIEDLFRADSDEKTGDEKTKKVREKWLLEGCLTHNHEKDPRYLIKTSKTSRVSSSADNDKEQEQEPATPGGVPKRLAALYERREKRRAAKAKKQINEKYKTAMSRGKRRLMDLLWTTMDCVKELPEDDKGARLKMKQLCGVLEQFQDEARGGGAGAAVQQQLLHLMPMPVVYKQQ